MKILIVSTSDIVGGAARAAYRLHRALLAEGIESRMLVQDKRSGDWTVISLANNKLEKAYYRIRPFIDQIPVKFYKNRTKTLFSPAWFGFSKVIKKINEMSPDIVHLHWICGGMIRIEDLAKIKKPIVWSLHDMWVFTGGCHYDEECRRYLNYCGNCKILNSKKENDLSKKIFNRKRIVFEKIENLTIIGLSSWLNECSKNSALLKDKRHINLPNPIDINIFKPFNKAKSRELWGLPKDKKLVLFGAMNATGDPRKGFKELSEALNILKGENIEFVVFGSSEPKNPPKFKFKIHYVGHLYDDISLVTLYNVCDVTVVPSLQENLSNTIMESLSCGTPVVAFNVGGNSDMIEHKINGYLATPFDPSDLAKGIEWVLGLSEKEYQTLSQNAREKVLGEFDSRVVARKYIELYEEILNKSIK